MVITWEDEEESKLTRNTRSWNAIFILFNCLVMTLEYIKNYYCFSILIGSLSEFPSTIFNEDAKTWT